MEYYPRLLIDPRLRNGLRVSKVDVNFKLYRTFRKFLYWSPITHSNAALFYGESELEKITFIKNIADQTSKFSNSAEIAFFDFNESSEDICSILSKTYKNFYSYKNYQEGLTQCLKDLIAFREHIRNANKGSGFLEPPGRKVTLIFLDLSLITDELNKPENIDMINDLLSNSSRERMYLFLIMPFAKDLDESVLKNLTWATFLELENSQLLKNLYPEKDDSYFSVRQKVIGMTFNVNDSRLQIIHPLKFTKSDWLISKEAALKAEDEIYKYMLESLDEGKKI